MSSNAASADADARALADIPVICGPTAAGKSAVAMWLADRTDVVIMSADSRQVYRGFDAGTGKPTAAERARVPHVGIDVVEPAKRYSAAAWIALATAGIAKARAEGRVPIVVGGTGFYISTLFRPLWDEPPLHAPTREALQAALGDQSTETLRRWCRWLDPARAKLGRAQLLRALEVAMLTGSRISDLHQERARQNDYTARYLVVDPGPPLSARIAARAEAMFGGGWVEEVRRLVDQVPADAPAWRSLGYSTVRRHALGEIDRNAALERVIIETRQYAKRQRTWFRHQLPPDRTDRLDPGAPGWEQKVEHWFDGAAASRLSESRITSHESR